jgi:hypothetical protein
MPFARKHLFLVKKVKFELFFEKKSQRRRLNQIDETKRFECAKVWFEPKKKRTVSRQKLLFF